MPKHGEGNLNTIVCNREIGATIHDAAFPDFRKVSRTRCNILLLAYLPRLNHRSKFSVADVIDGLFSTAK